MTHGRRLAALAIAVAVALPVGASAAPPPPLVVTQYYVSDGVSFSGLADGGRVRLSGTALHVDLVQHWVDGSGPHSYTVRGAAYCLLHESGSGWDYGCVVDLGAGRVTTGEPEPESATIRVRVPSRDRPGGWIEADLTAVSTGQSTRPMPYYLSPHVEQRHVAGPLSVPAHVYTSAGEVHSYYCDLAGTSRTDRARATRLTPGATCVIYRYTSMRTDGGITGLMKHLRERAEAAMPR